MRTTRRDSIFRIRLHASGGIMNTQYRVSAKVYDAGSIYIEPGPKDTEIIWEASVPKGTDLFAVRLMAHQAEEVQHPISWIERGDHKPLAALHIQLILEKRSILGWTTVELLNDIYRP